MKRISFFLTASLTMAALIFTSCEKMDNSPIADDLVSDDEVASYFEELLSEMEDITTESTDAKTDAEYKVSSSGSRTVETTFSKDTAIHTVTFTDFVNGNSQHQRVKNGVMIIKVLGKPIDETFWRQISFDNFSVNGNTVEGVKEVEKTGEYQFTITLTGGKVNFTDGTIHTRDFEHIRTWTAGYDTPFFIWDDEFEIEGSASGINRNEQNYSRTIINPLKVKRNCRWIVEGSTEIEVGDRFATLDYGNGECDRYATVTVDDESWTINLRGGSM